MLIRHTLVALIGGLAGALLLSLPAAAAPGGNGNHGNGGNPNGNPPVGQPIIKGDTDRGHSENKGRSGIAGAHVIGSVTLIHGDVVTIRSSNGTTQAFTLTPAQVAEVRAGEHVVFFTNGASVTKVSPAIVSFHGVITSLVPNATTRKTTVVVRLPNGKLNTISVANEAAENMLLRKGEPVIVSTSTAFLTPPTITVISPK